MLRKRRIVRVDKNVTGLMDERRRVDRYIVEYTDSECVEYRKGFEVTRGSTPNIPAGGTHEYLNSLKRQY